MSEAARLVHYRYRASAADGREIVSTIAAPDRDAAVAAIYESGLIPFETTPVTDAGPRAATPDQGGSTPRLSLKALKAFTFELASLTRAELALDAVLRNIASSAPDTPVGRMARLLLQDLLGGAQLSEAMSRHPRSFGPDYRAIISAGEMASALPRVLGEIDAHLGRRLDTRGKITAALVYPAILVVMSLLSVGTVATVLIPSLTPIFADAHLPLPGILGAIVALESNAGTAALVGVLVVAALVGAGLLTRNPAVRLGLDRILAGLPVIGRFIRAAEAARFMRGLGTLVSAGVPLMPALQIGRDLVGNRDLARRYRAAVARVPEGESLGAVLAEADLMPASALRLVTLGEDTARLGPMLAQAAALIEADQQKRMDQMLNLLTPLLTLGIGGAVAALVMSVMGAVMSINDVAFR